MINFRTGKAAQPRLRNSVALDIGSAFIKILEISDSSSSDKPKLTRLGMHRSPHGGSGETLPDSIKALVGESGISSKNVNISVSGPSVIVRHIPMPKMTDEELANALKFEAEKFIPFNVTECITDFKVLRKIEQENKIEVLFVAAKKDYIEKRISIIESCGLSVEVVDVDSFALANTFCRNFSSLEPERTSALLNIGLTLTTLGIIKNGILHLVRDMPIGVKDFDAALSKGLNVDLVTAGEIILKPEKGPENTVECVKTVFNSLIDELRLPFSYYENHIGKSVDDIYISGGGSRVFCLEEMFQEAFGAKPIFWNPLQFLDASSPYIDRGLLDNMNSFFAITAGLALR